MKQWLLQLRTAQKESSAPKAWVGAIGGGVLILVAFIFIGGGIELGFGSARRLGSGAFPIITGIALALLGIAIVILDMNDDTDAERPDWISFFAIGLSLAVFAISAERSGLVPAVFLTTVIASSPDPSLRLSGKLLLGVVVAIACWLLFIKALGLPFTAFKGF